MLPLQNLAIEWRIQDYSCIIYGKLKGACPDMLNRCIRVNWSGDDPLRVLRFGTPAGWRDKEMSQQACVIVRCAGAVTQFL